jgi:hypothetical protein
MIQAIENVCPEEQGCQIVCFQTINPNLGKLWRVLQAMEDAGIFYGHLVHFMVFCYLLWTFGIVCGNLVYFPVLVFCTKKNLATLLKKVCLDKLTPTQETHKPD